MAAIDAPPVDWPDTEIRSHQAGGRESWALFSTDGHYRYRLRRFWGDGARLGFLMLNPSTASELRNDPTVERCERRAKQWGYDGFEVANIFALRATDPKRLYASDDPVGSFNILAIDAMIASTDRVLCAWGAHGRLLGHGAKIRDHIARSNAQLCHLGLTKAGEPRHPLYVAYSEPMRDWILR